MTPLPFVAPPAKPSPSRTSPRLRAASSSTAAPPYANSITVTLNLNVSGADPGSTVRFSNAGGEWSAWSDLTATKAWSLSGGDGMKTVYAQFKDAAGNVSDQVWNNIILDTTPPTGSIAINSGAQYATQGAVTLNLWAATDGGSPVIQMWVYNQIYSSVKNAWMDYSYPPVECVLYPRRPGICSPGTVKRG